MWIVSCRRFPWIVEIFDLCPYHFHRVVEIIIRAEDGLSRDVVKHLNHVSLNILMILIHEINGVFTVNCYPKT